MHVVVRKSIGRTNGGAKRIRSQHFAAPPIAHLDGIRQEDNARKRLFQPEIMKYTRAVRAQLDSGADFGELGRLLEYVHRKSLLRETKCGCDAANAAARNEYVGRQSIHDCAHLMVVEFVGCEFARISD